MKFKLSYEKLNPKYHYEKWKSILNPNIELEFNSKDTGSNIFKTAVNKFVYCLLSYIVFYFVLFILGYPYYSSANEKISEEFALKGQGGLGLIFNSYPFNVIYVLVLIVFFSLFMAVSTHFLMKLLEEEKRPFLQNAGICLHSMCFWIAILFVLVVLNTIYPFNEPTSIILFSILVASWIILFSVSVFFSTRFYGKASASFFNQNQKRAYIGWLVPLAVFFYFIAGIIAS